MPSRSHGRTPSLVLLAATGLLCLGNALCLSAEPEAAGPETVTRLDLSRDTVTQVSSYNGLLAGLLDGHVRYEALKPYGNFGVGTFDKLDGEMLMVDGELFQVAFSGKVNRMPLAATTPYATVTQFQNGSDRGVARRNALRQGRQVH